MVHSLDELPLEILHIVASMIPPTTLGMLSCVARFWQGLCEDDEVWRVMYDLNFGGPMDGYEYRSAVHISHVNMKKIENDNQRMIWAIKKGHHSLVRHILETTSEDANYKDPTGLTCLFLACRNGSLDVAKVLLAFGARADDTNPEGETALHAASMAGYSQIIPLLVAHKAMVNFQDHAGRSALHKAAYYGRTNVVATLLQIPGINVELKERCYSQTAFHIACGRNHIEIVTLLLAASCNINAADQDGWTPLRLACYKGNAGIVSELLHHHEVNRDCLRTLTLPRNIADLFLNIVK